MNYDSPAKEQTACSKITNLGPRSQFPKVGGPSANINFDVSSAVDSQLAGYTFTAVSATSIPEPSSLFLLTIAGTPLLRRRRKISR